jgi:hypothetical protein
MAKFKPGAYERLLEDYASDVVEGLDLDACVQLAYEAILVHLGDLSPADLVTECISNGYGVEQYVVFNDPEDLDEQIES